MKPIKNDKTFRPDRVLSYFRVEWLPLAFVTLSGLVYNIGLLATPWFEGRLAQCLADILGGSETAANMALLVLAYILVTLLVQAARFIKRFYVRRFANNINRRMKGILYANLVRQSKAALEQQGAGELMTKAISDVDDCVEGMRKFTTEIFDTGVALGGYVVMLLVYDWRLALLSLLFTPFSYVCAAWMKKPVQRAGAAYKKAAGALSAATLDRAQNAATYRIYGCEDARVKKYEDALNTYEKTAVRNNVWQSALPPLYLAASNAGVLFILWFGAKNVLGTGWTVWSIAEFTTFLACFTKLATKSSKAAKLFNAVHKAQVSWKRIQPLMREIPAVPAVSAGRVERLEIRDLTCGYPGDAPLFSGLDLTACRGQIIGVTGPVACGKSTLGKAFLCEQPYGGSIRLDGRELAELPQWERTGLVGYLGHDPELFSGTIRENVLLGDTGDPMDYLRAVCLDGEVAAMTEGLETRVGTGGVRLSGGQAQRLALARTLAHQRPLLILDDPFSALDRATETEIFAHLRRLAADSVVILISHRLYLFPELDRVIWLENGEAKVGTHEELVGNTPDYAAQFDAQRGEQP